VNRKRLRETEGEREGEREGMMECIYRRVHGERNRGRDY
jgi:hypothetical protein